MTTDMFSRYYRKPTGVDIAVQLISNYPEEVVQEREGERGVHESRYSDNWYELQVCWNDNQQVADGTWCLWYHSQGRDNRTFDELVAVGFLEELK